MLRAGYSPLLAVLLALRGYADPGQARDFLSGGDQSVFDPMLLQDMDKAVARIRTAIERRENVAVFGDYDVDGITSTCVLTDYLRLEQGVPVHPYIPDRIEEGYGLNTWPRCDKLHAGGARSSSPWTAASPPSMRRTTPRSCGIDIVINRPPRVRRAGSHARTPWPSWTRSAPAAAIRTAGLAGVGVAFKLLCARGRREQVLRNTRARRHGTVADVMPLTGENRYIVARGWSSSMLAPGRARALLDECGAEGRPDLRIGSFFIACLWT